MQPADVLIPMFTDLNNEILDIDYELKAIISCTTREGRILLQALVLTTAFLEFVRKKESDRGFEREHLIKIKEKAEKEYYDRLIKMINFNKGAIDPQVQKKHDRNEGELLANKIITKIKDNAWTIAMSNLESSIQDHKNNIYKTKEIISQIKREVQNKMNSDPNPATNPDDIRVKFLTHRNELLV